MACITLHSACKSSKLSKSSASAWIAISFWTKSPLTMFVAVRSLPAAVLAMFLIAPSTWSKLVRLGSGRRATRVVSE